MPRPKHTAKRSSELPDRERPAEGAIKKKSTDDSTAKSAITKKRKKIHGDSPKEALAAIEFYQKSTEPCVCPTHIKRLAREIGAEIHEELRYTKECMTMLTWWSDHFLSDLFSKAQTLSEHRDKATITVNDLKMVLMMDSTYSQMAPAFISRLKVQHQKATHEKMVSRLEKKIEKAKNLTLTAAEKNLAIEG